MHPLIANWMRFVARRRQRTVRKDDFMFRLPSTVIGQGMMDEGNYFLFDYALQHLPKDGDVLEIGSYGGFSMNLVLHLLAKYQQLDRRVYSCDPWIYSGYQDEMQPPTKHMDGHPGVSRVAFMEYVLSNFKESLALLRPDHLPFSTRKTSDDFFTSWYAGEEMMDVFGRNFKPGSKLAFVYIDGDHSEAAARKDLENSIKALVPGGWILLDDSAPWLPYGSARLVPEFMARQELECVFRNPNALFRKK